MTKEEKVNLVIGTGMNIPGISLGPKSMEAPVVGETLKGVAGAAGTTVPDSAARHPGHRPGRRPGRRAHPAEAAR